MGKCQKNVKSDLSLGPREPADDGLIAIRRDRKKARDGTDKRSADCMPIRPAEKPEIRML
jgi:hypothetical protein